MVKQAEKQKKRNPLLPIFGLIIAVGLGFAAWFIAEALIQGVPALRPFRGEGRNASIGQLAIAFGLWLAMLAVAYLIVALIVGTDPTEKAKKEIGLPPRQVRKKK